MISLQFLLTAFVVVLAPGTGVLYTLVIGLGQGRGPAVAAAIGCTLGIVPHLMAASFGLAAVLHASALAFNVVKFAGVGYLLWLAWQSLRSGGTLSLSEKQRAEPMWRIARRAALINILNPKLSIFFLALLPPFLSGDATRVTLEMAQLGSVFMGMTFGIFVLYGVFAAFARNWVLGSARVVKGLNRSFAAVFAALAGRLALEQA